MLNEESQKFIYKAAVIKLLEIKESDIRITTLEQSRDAIDKAIHAGGAMSAIIPLTALYYGDFIHFDIEQPTRRGQDLFVLSKGHGIATMASIYADLGYFERSALKNTRSIDSIIKGHPGPTLPGVLIPTGPLGQGACTAQGFAVIGKMNPSFDVFTLTGDGELQEGIIWESVLYAGYKKLDNLCWMIDFNNGQMDETKQLNPPLGDLKTRFISYNWRVFNVDATQIEPVYNALAKFKFGPRDGRPTAIICNSLKGYGGFSDYLGGHKVKMDDNLLNQEFTLQRTRRDQRSMEFFELWTKISDSSFQEQLDRTAKGMNFEIIPDEEQNMIRSLELPVKTQPAPIRDKKIIYDESKLPVLDPANEYQAYNIITQAMKVFAQDPRVASIDADIATVSGLRAGVGFVDVNRALNVGVAEANMMNNGEAFAVMGYNTWVSTFCPFFDWKVLRRIAVGYQERLEVIGTNSGWLSQGHNLDLTFLGCSANLETVINGATHMGNDDSMVYGEIAHLKIIDTSCPNQVLAVMKWIMEGDKGLVYLRIMRAPSKPIYPNGVSFQYGKGYIIKENESDQVVLISSGRGVYEALNTYDILAQDGISISVVDMPSIDEEMLLSFYDSGKNIFIAEQNNGYIYSKFREILFNRGEIIDPSRIIALNALDKDNHPRFIHSGIYPQLLNFLGLSPDQIAIAIKSKINTL